MVLAHAWQESGSDGIHWAAIVTSLAALIGAGGIVWAAKQAQLARKTWLAQATRDIWQGWNDVGDARRSADAHWGAARLAEHVKTLDWSSDEFGLLIREPNFFEQLGVLSELGGLDFDLIDEHLGPAIVERWRMWHLAIIEIRSQQKERGAERTPENFAYRAFQALAKRMAEKHNLEIPEMPDPDLS